MRPTKAKKLEIIKDSDPAHVEKVWSDWGNSGYRIWVEFSDGGRLRVGWSGDISVNIKADQYQSIGNSKDVFLWLKKGMGPWAKTDETKVKEGKAKALAHVTSLYIKNRHKVKFRDKTSWLHRR